MKNSKIEWTDHTFNPWIGCTKVSQGCKNCYAERLMDKRLGRAKWGDQGERVRTSEAYWKGALRWNAKLEGTGHRERVFCASLADAFEDNRQVEDWRLDLFRLIFDTPHLDWLLLTKRPQNAIPFLDDACWPETGCAMFGSDDPFPSNVWLGTSVEDQVLADERISQLATIPAKMRFLSVEPLLGPVTLGDLSQIDWVIIGGESGPNARPMNLEWVKDILAQCREANIPAFVKQLGEDWAKKAGAAHKKGGDPDEWPHHWQSSRMFPGEAWENE